MWMTIWIIINLNRKHSRGEFNAEICCSPQTQQKNTCCYLFFKKLDSKIMVKKTSRSSLEQKLEVKFLDDLQTVCREILRSMHNCPTTYV